MKMILAAMLIASPLAAQTQASRQGPNAYRVADAALNAQYRTTLAVMAKNDVSRNDSLRKGIEQPDGGAGFRASLLASQRAWLAYRDAQCTLAAYEFRGGSAESMAKGQCLTDLTRRRTAELRQMQQSFSPK